MRIICELNFAKKGGFINIFALRSQNTCTNIFKLEIMNKKTDYRIYTHPLACTHEL